MTLREQSFGQLIARALGLIAILAVTANAVGITALRTVVESKDRVVSINAQMLIDIEAARTARVDGIVIGLLTADGNIDKDRTRELLILAQPMSVTFHRAFDVCRDPLVALEDLIEIGVDRVLTSGQHADALSGAKTIKKLVEAAGDRIVVMACGGIDETTAAEVVAATAASELHFTAFGEIASEMEYKNEAVTMGSDEGPSEYLLRVTSAERVSRIIGAAQRQVT